MRYTRVLIQALIAGVVLSAATPATAAMRSLALIVRDQLYPDGTVGYFLDLHDTSASFVINRVESLTGPDGVIIEEIPEFWNSRRFSSLQSLSETAVGDWIFRSAPQSNPSAVEEYRFSISPFLGEQINLVRPVFTTSPGATPNSFRITRDPPSSPLVLLIDTSKAHHETSIAGVLELAFEPDAVSPVRIRAWTSQALNAYIESPTHPVNEFYATLSYRRSTEASVSPVPEPSSLVLLASFGTMMLLRRGR